MKKIALATFGLLLATSPAFADAFVDQSTYNNIIGNSENNSYADSATAGVATTSIVNSSGIINQNVNTGNASNVGSATDLVVTGGIAEGGGNVYAGNASDTNKQLAYATLGQVSAYNHVGNAWGATSNSESFNDGVSGVSVSASTGIINQSINAGNASNVGSVTGITIH